MLSVGIVGLPNVGKSTLFNALLKRQQALVANYPFATIEPNVGVVPVPDERIEKLADLVAGESQPDGLVSPGQPRRVGRPPVVPAVVQFVDIAGLVKGASGGAGLGNQFLSHIREVDAIVEVVRVFEDENIIRSGSVDPRSDVEVVRTELILADLQVVQNSKLKAQGSRLKLKTNDEEIRALVLGKVESELNNGKMVSEIDLTGEEREAIRDLQLLTAKPILYVFNVSERQLGQDLRGIIPVSGIIPNGAKPLIICAQVEAELAALSESEQAEYLHQLGVKESGLDAVIRAGYEALNLISFLTAGPKEVRAWTIKKGAKAPQAAGVIHSDFERGFIAAEVISADELLNLGSFRLARERGKVRLEGKEYEVKDGDVVEFRFSV